jgi:hypothetical protein
MRSQISSEATSKLPIPLVIIPVFWITFLSFVYGLFAPRNATVTLVLFFCAVSIVGAIKAPLQPFRTPLEMIGPA